MCSLSVKMSAEGVLLGMCNPLLDISAVVDQEFMDKYGIVLNNAILAEDKHKPMYPEMESKFACSYIAGGAGLNTIRVAQWILGTPMATSYLGCVGDDEYGRKMEAACKTEGVNAHFMKDATTATGTCAVCVMDAERSLVANLSAANNYKKEHLMQPENYKLLEMAKVVYVTGFFCTVSPESLFEEGEHCVKNGKTFCMNLSAPFLIQVPPLREILVKGLANCSIVFGNESEAAAFAEAHGWAEKDIPAIAVKIAETLTQPGARVCITQGSEPTVLATKGDPAARVYPVPPVPKAEIVDTNGAGDAFVGGFLASLVQKKPEDVCVAAGNHAAGIIIRTSGCKLPDGPADF